MKENKLIKINKYIDHTLLKANAISTDIIKLCDEAKKYQFKSVCVNPFFVKLAKKILKDSNVLICTVIGFPLGASTTETKINEALDAIKNKADEIDMVINISLVKEHNYEMIEKEIHKIKKSIGKHILKVILETCLLTNEEIINASLASKKAGADFVKTSTGFSTGGATIEAVKIMRKAVGKKMGVKASGGIHNFNEALSMIEAGATRIGTSSGIMIMNSIEK